MGIHKDNEIWKDFAIFLSLIIIISMALYMEFNWNSKVQQMTVPCVESK